MFADSCIHPNVSSSRWRGITEILFALIMVLTFTCSFSVAGAGREQVRTMLIGALVVQTWHGGSSMPSSI